MPIQTALTGDNAGSHSPDTGIKRNPRPIVDMAETPDNLSAPESIPSATTPIPASNPLNGVLVTLATLGVITASAGAITMTATALAKKKEQDEAKAAQLAHLQAEQALQAETASANYAENQQKQAQATANVVMAGKQSQANKNFWYAYALWQQKVAQAEQKQREARLQALIQAYLLWKASQNVSRVTTSSQVASSNITSTTASGRFILGGGFGFGASGGFIGLTSSIISRIALSIPRLHQEPTPTPTPTPEPTEDEIEYFGMMGDVAVMPMPRSVPPVYHQPVNPPVNPPAPVYTPLNGFWSGFSSVVASAIRAFPQVVLPVAAVGIPVFGIIYVLLTSSSPPFWTAERILEYEHYRLCDSVAPSERPGWCNGQTLPFPITTPFVQNPSSPLPTEAALTIEAYPVQTPWTTPSFVPPPVFPTIESVPIETPTLIIFEYRSPTPDEEKHIRRLTEIADNFLPEHPDLLDEIERYNNGEVLKYDHIREARDIVAMIEKSQRTLQQTIRYYDDENRQRALDAIENGNHVRNALTNILSNLRR